MTKGNRYFLVWLWNSAIKEIVKIKSINGILLPDNIKAEIKTIKKIGIKNFKYLLESLLKNNGIKKNENIENLWRYPPAINSSPNGPDNFLPTGSKPKISFPKINW